VVVLPFDSKDSPWKAIAAIVTLNDASPDAAAAEKLQADLRQAAADVRAGVTRSPLGDAPAIRTALAALRRDNSRKPALVLLTTMSSAPIAGDFVLVADDAQLAALASEAQRFASGGIPKMPDLQWFLEAYVLRTLCEKAEKGALSPELQSVLALHAGDVARRPDAILELLKQVGNPEALNQRLIAENLIALEDNSPAARVRAFDWLSSRGQAPAGFDPLADARSRRAAIDKAMNPPGGQP
jgi:hypothetical protein